MSVAIRRMTARALEILDSADAGARARLMLPLAGETVRDWHYVPRERPGLALGEMSGDLRDRTWRLVETGLSAEGRRKAHDITRLEKILGEIEDRRDYRDPLNYSLAFFGQPSQSGLWGWRFEGHHLSLTFIVDPKRGLVTTPIFFGANRQRVPDDHEHGGWRVLPVEEDRGFELVNGFADKERSRAIIADRSPGDIITGPGRERELMTPAGVGWVEVAAESRRRIEGLLDLYLGNLDRDQAILEEKRIREAGLEEIRFAWAGSLEPGIGHYYRLSGPTFIIEYENSQNDANHCHSVWHNPRSQLRIDPLAEHYHRAH